VSLTLRVQRDAGPDPLRLQRAELERVLAIMAEVTVAAEQRGLAMTPPTPVEIMAMRGVLEQSADITEDTNTLRAALIDDLRPLLDDFNAVRAAEGAALAGVLAGQIDLIAALTLDAATEAATRRAALPDTLREALARVLGQADGIDESRVAQEIALIAVKADVTEEIDRLTAHVAAARALLAESAPVGRKLDFLTQEFNREANTLCSKAQSIALTRIGLDLKTVIDQMREQVQNVE
jgi:uncharacterized protein (TIGR00255 family)